MIQKMMLSTNTKKIIIHLLIEQEILLDDFMCIDIRILLWCAGFAWLQFIYIYIYIYIYIHIYEHILIASQFTIEMYSQS